MMAMITKPHIAVRDGIYMAVCKVNGDFYLGRGIDARRAYIRLMHKVLQHRNIRLYEIKFENKGVASGTNWIRL